MALRTVCTLIALSLVVCPLPATAQDEEADIILEQARAAFSGMAREDIARYFKLRRPPKVSDEDKRFLLQDLPFVNDRNRITDAEKIALLKERILPVLKFHDRHEVIEVILFEDERPLCFSKAGAVLGFSTGLLEVVKTDAGLMGTAAHELAHEYTALEAYKAHKAEDTKRLRQIELICDVLATVTLFALEIDPQQYNDALARVCTHTPEAEALNDGSGQMPHWKTRQRVISCTTQMLNPAKP